MLQSMKFGDNQSLEGCSYFFQPSRLSTMEVIKVFHLKTPNTPDMTTTIPAHRPDAVLP